MGWRATGWLAIGRNGSGCSPPCMHLDDFRAMIDRLARDVPAEFSDGIVAIEVSPKALPHPRRGDVYTLGECIPLEWSGSGADLQSRVVLYHGSFAALARLGDFFVALDDSGARGKEIEIPWHGRAYRVAVPPVEPTAALFLILDGLRDPAPGDAVVVVKPARGLRDLLRRHPAPVQVVARATPLDA